MHTGGVPDQNKEQCGREQELKNMFKRNQVMITALAIMIAVAGYLNFAGTKVGEEELADVGASAGQESDMEALLELSDEDGKEDIASLDSDTEDVAAENFLNENMQTISDQDVAALTDDAADSAEEALDAEVQEGEIPGGSKDICSSPWLFAAYHVLHRLSVPRHPPCALYSLTIHQYIALY